MDTQRDLENSMAYLDAIYSIVNARLAEGKKPSYAVVRLLNALSKAKENLPQVLREEVTA